MNGGGKSGFTGNPDWYRFKNDSGEEIPPHAFIRADNGNKDADGQVWISAKKPNASGMGSDIYVNGPLAVPNGGWGFCTNSQIVAIQYDDTDAPIAGDIIGPKSGSWLGWKDYSGAQVLTLNDTNETMPIAWIVRQNCKRQNHKIVITLFGPPTGGTWDLPTWNIDGSTDSITGLSATCTAATLETEIEGHSGVGSNNVQVSGGPADSANFIVEFIGDLANKEIDTPIVDYGSLTGTVVGGLAYPIQIGR